jgi:Ca2+-binding RTX toxin-like protein
VTASPQPDLAAPLQGTPGPDCIEGAAAPNDVSGGAGADYLYGNADADVLDGGPGDDYLFGGGGPDTLDGGEGADTLNGGPGDDVLFGGPGDVLQGAAGDDALHVTAQAGVVVADGGCGFDTVYVSCFDEGDVDPAATTASPKTGGTGVLALGDATLYLVGIEAVVFVGGTCAP